MKWIHSNECKNVYVYVATGKGHYHVLFFAEHFSNGSLFSFESSKAIGANGVHQKELDVHFKLA